MGSTIRFRELTERFDWKPGRYCGIVRKVLKNHSGMGFYTIVHFLFGILTDIASPPVEGYKSY